MKIENAIKILEDFKLLQFPVIKEAIETVLKEIEKQQKELEDLDRKNTRQHELICKIHQKWKVKIKAKIEEVDKDENASIHDFMEYAKEYAKQKLQSLLEKEEE